jgi:hypothetical protein
MLARQFLYQLSYFAKPPYWGFELKSLTLARQVQYYLSHSGSLWLLETFPLFTSSPLYRE